MDKAKSEDKPKDEMKLLEEKLAYQSKSAWEKYGKDTGTIFKFVEGYKSFLDNAKTERDAALEIENIAKKGGFVSAESAKSDAKRLYFTNRNKNIALVKLGKNKVSEGMRIITSHLDSPRLDLKQNPLYEESELALLKTHYYGGIKKYQWVNVPLAMHGVVITKDNKKIMVKIGEEDKDPVFLVSDLLIHLSKKQLEKNGKEVVEGEDLNVLMGNIPVTSKEVKEKVKLAILKELHDTYGIIEGDLLSADIEMVPAYKARDIGLDRSMVASYGQDDRSCAYASLEAVLEAEPKYATIVLFMDKEEIGSEGNTAIQSSFLELIVTKLLEREKPQDIYYNMKVLLSKAEALSADVDAALDPTYKDAFEARNSAFMGKGVILNKFTGHGGKYDGSDAGAEYLTRIRNMLDREGISWQIAELGKVDLGGGGTDAKFLARYGMDVLDCGPGVLGMHSPYEVVSKVDLYETYRAYKAFIERL